ncbi:peptidase U34 [Parvibaculum lavamentivorans]|nr:peptidase U34 [Parvibaculum lavamentivorans]
MGARDGEGERLHMCDTLVARPRATATGALLFAKNSDREANEAQYPLFVPAASHPKDATLRCTYIEIPQAAATHAVLLSRPFWMWGAEMGANEHGVVIGNEAVHAKIAPGAAPALIGMDLLRLGLERGASAAEAVDVITALLATHGQGGNCAHKGRFEYHNSFIVADAAGDAFVLETVGREWAVERVAAKRSISNSYTIGSGIDRASQGAAALAAAHGFLKEGDTFHFADAFANRKRSALASGHQRWCRTSALLNARAGGLTQADMMAFLRDHGAQAARSAGWRPDGILGGAVSAHATYGPVRRFGQTTASWVAELGEGHDGSKRAVHWLTATAAPDTGIFKPVFFGPGFEAAALPDFGPAPTDLFNAKTRWWRHERLHRAVLRNYPARLAAYREERDRLEASFVARVEAFLARGGGPEEAGALSRAIWREADRAEAHWLEQVLKVPENPAHRPSPFMTAHWRSLDRQARMA